MRPISEPEGRYPLSDIPDLSRLPVVKGRFHLEEPCLYLLRTDWQQDRSGMSQYMGFQDATPEMGMELEKELGGILTVIVLCFGDYPNLHQRCLESVVRSLPPYRLDLRVALNCVGSDTKDFVETLTATKVYEYSENKYKYPILRDIIRDTEAPLLGDYVAWFDDNAYVTEPNWVNILAKDMQRQGPNVGMYGIRMYQPMRHGSEDAVQDWIRSQSWYRHQKFMDTNGVSGGSGSKAFHFCADWFWVAKKQALIDADIPCEDLVQRGGGPIIGEQLHQAGYTIKQFNVGKAYVFIPPFKKQVRRGDPGPFPWQVATG